LPGGRYNIVLFGTERFRIKRERPPTATRLYRIAEVELLDETHDHEDDADFAHMRAQVMDLFGELMKRLGYVDGCAPDLFDETENAVLINSIASASSFKAEERQRLLEENGVRARFEQLAVLLRFALAELDTGRTLRSGFIQ
jgi:Lon protease-like protein